MVDDGAQINIHIAQHRKNDRDILAVEELRGKTQREWEIEKENNSLRRTSSFPSFQYSVELNGYNKANTTNNKPNQTAWFLCVCAECSL